MIEYIAGSSDLQQNEGLPISHSVVMICGVSQHLWSIKPTWAWEKETLITHIPPFFGIGLNPYTMIWNRCSPSYASMTYSSQKGYDTISCWTEWELYPGWRLPWLGIFHISRACTTLWPHSMGGLWVERQQCLLPIELLAHTSLISSWSTQQSRIITEATSYQPYEFSMIIARTSSSLGNSPIHSIKIIELHYQLLGGWTIGITHNVAMT